MPAGARRLKEGLAGADAQHQDEQRNQSNRLGSAVTGPSGIPRPDRGCHFRLARGCRCRPPDGVAGLVERRAVGQHDWTGGRKLNPVGPLSSARTHHQCHCGARTSLDRLSGDGVTSVTSAPTVPGQEAVSSRSTNRGPESRGGRILDGR